ncbi:type II toxin-antitoxin system HicA family toxin [Eubacterium sp. AM49-13BH]|nr:type II toxin-antitoxin system HicA family toxin [Eubacterium sp. AM49-13BH]
MLQSIVECPSKNGVSFNKTGKVTIPNHKGDVDIKTVNSILKQAGLK